DQDAVFVLVRTGDPAARATTAAELAAAIRRISPELVSRVEDDDAETRAYLRDHAHLFVPLADLERARDALAAAIERGKLAANPLYVSLDDDDDAAAAAAERATLDDLVAQRRDALARLDRSGLISDDGTLQLLIVRTAFAKTDAARGEQLMDALVSVRAEVMARPGHDGVEVGLCAGVATTVAEHHALVRGMLLSSLITVVLVALALWLYLRSLRLLAALGTTLTIGTVASFGVAAVTVGHLNAATAFLGAIIAGNGVNYGILLLGRYVEERRRRDAVAAMGVALAEGARPTLVASLGAAIAYGSLAATSFRGFADFAVIGGVGMVLCWIASFTVLPAAILRLAPDAAAAPRGSGLGAAMARVLGF
ncbi:MAG: MMPL family transporter, partial [Kofleriaceae bacterium]|nr:MMPL family transporter [Kofleriaceae bacterium]